MLRRLVSLVLVTVLATSGLVIAGSPAQAAAKPKLTIKKIATQTVGYHDVVTVKPRVSKKGPVKIRSKTLTVTQKGKRVAKAKKSVKLKTGTYRVTQVVKYKVKKKGKYGKTKTKKRAQTLKVTKPKGCATKSDYAKVKTVEMASYGQATEEEIDTIITAAKDLRSNGSLYGKATLADLRQRAVNAGEGELVEFIDWLSSNGYTGQHVWEIRTYKLCKNKKRAEVQYIAGDAWYKTIL